MSLIDEYKEAFKEADELIHTLIQITANGVDPKDFGKIRAHARKWRSLHMGVPYVTDKELIMARKTVANEK